MVVTVLAAMVLVFAREMHTEAIASSNHAANAQANWIARGAIEAIRGDLAEAVTNGEAPHLSEVEAQGMELGGGMFWIIRPNYEDDQKHAFGLISEAGKININTASADVLVECPGIDENLAAAIVDWRDEDLDLTPGGAESEYYLTRPTPYNAKDGDFDTIGELLLVRDIDAAIFYGEDTNQNGVLEPIENDGSNNLPDDNSNGDLDRGLIDYLTVYSTEPDTDSAGDDRISLNQPGQELNDLLTSAFGEERFSEIAGEINLQRPYQNVLDFYLRAELTEDEFEAVHDQLTTQIQAFVLDFVPFTLIDVYYASAEVIDALPGMDPGDGRLIVAARPDIPQGEQPGSLAWVADALGEDKIALVGASLTYRSYQFTADVVAISGDGRGFCRLRVVLDVAPVLDGSATLPQIVYIQDLTARGWPLAPEVLTAVKAGTPLEQAASMQDTSTP